jgi:hypothetical protein
MPYIYQIKSYVTVKITLWGFDVEYLGRQLSMFHVPEKHTASSFRVNEYYYVHKNLPLSYLKPVQYNPL